MKLSGLTMVSALPLLLSACGQSLNRTMFETESRRDESYIAKEYGTSPATITLERQGRSLSFAVRTGRSHPRILVEGSDDANAAASGTVNRLTLGVVRNGLDGDAFREAALFYLASTGKRDCSLLQGGQIGSRFEWTYSCQA